MPQLDRLSWFSQIFWLILVFIFLYYLFVSVFLPQLAFSLKFRSKYLKTVKALDAQKHTLHLTELQQEYRNILKAFSKSRVRVYILTRVRKLYFLEEYSLFLMRGKFSRKTIKTFVEGFVKLRFYYRLFKKGF